MKFTVNLKCPDALDDALREAVALDLEMDLENLDRETFHSRIDERVEEVKELVSNFVEYDECYRIEFDTTLGTARVLESKCKTSD